MSSHIAIYEKSARLQKMVAFLQKRGKLGATTWAIYYLTRICGIPQAIGELRDARNGFKIECIFVREKGMAHGFSGTSTRAGSRKRNGCWRGCSIGEHMPISSITLERRIAGVKRFHERLKSNPVFSDGHYYWPTNISNPAKKDCWPTAETPKCQCASCAERK